MKKTFLITTVVFALIISAFTVSMLWKADEKNSSISFEGGGKKGTFGNLSSTINFDKANLKDSKIIASIDVKTLNAGNERLDAHLKSADFFDADKFPKIIFASSEIKASDKGYVAIGNLSMKDSIKVIELPFTFTEDGKEKGTFYGTITVFAGDYGVIKKSKEGNDKFVVSLVIPVTK